MNQQEQPKEADQVHQFRKNISVNTFLSIPFSSINFYDTIYFAIYMIISVALFVYKVQKYPFPDYAINMQAIFLTLFSLSHFLRFQLAKQSIAEKQPKKIIFYIIVSIFIIPLYVFQLRLQTYVLLVDFIINWIGLGLSIAEFGTAIWVFVIYTRKRNHS